MSLAEPLFIVAIAAALGCFASGLWGTRRHFVVHSQTPRGMWILTLLSFAAWTWFGVRLARSGLGPAAGVGIAAMVAAIALFWYAVATTRSRPPAIAFAQTQPSTFYSRGPYRFVRHPFYVSYLLCWVGTSLVTRGLLSWVVPVLFAVIYFRLAVQEELTFMHSEFAATYKDYQRRVGMFFPKPMPGHARQVT